MRFIFHYGLPDVNRRRLAKSLCSRNKGIIGNALLARRRDIRKFDERLVNANPDRYSQKKIAFIFERENRGRRTWKRCLPRPFVAMLSCHLLSRI